MGNLNSFVAGDILSSLLTGSKIEEGAIALYSPSRTKFGAQFMQMLKVGGFVANIYSWVYEECHCSNLYSFRKQNKME